MFMARPKKARTVRRYSDEFKLKAVGLANLDGVLTRDVAEALAIHPFMLSRWKKEVRDGVIVRKRGMAIDLDRGTVAELRRLREIERKYKLLQQEHVLLKKAIRFCSERRRRSSSTSI
jgi:transposase